MALPFCFKFADKQVPLRCCKTFCLLNQGLLSALHVLQGNSVWQVYTLKSQDTPGYEAWISMVYTIKFTNSKTYVIGKDTYLNQNIICLQALDHVVCNYTVSQNFVCLSSKLVTPVCVCLLGHYRLDFLLLFSRLVSPKFKKDDNFIPSHLI